MAEDDNNVQVEDRRLASGPVNRKTMEPLKTDNSDTSDEGQEVTPNETKTVLRVYSRLRYPVRLAYNDDTIFIPPQGIVDLDPSLFEGELPMGLQSQTVEV